MNKQDSSQDDKNIFTTCLTFKNVNESQFKDFYSIANRIQEDKLFQGKKHYEKVMIISYSDQFNDIQDQQEILEHIQENINEEFKKLMSANDHNIQLGDMKMMGSMKEVSQKKSEAELVNIHMLLQCSQKKCDQNIIQKMKRILKTDLYEERQISRSSIYQYFYRPHTDVFQYPTQNRLILNNFSYGMQKNPSSEFIKIWDLSDLKDLYKSEKEGCQGVSFVEFIHKKNFKDENQFFIFFTLKVLDYYIPFQIQVQVESIYTRDLYQNSENDFTLFLKIVGFPKVSKSLEVNNKFYYHYDFLNWQRYPNFLLGKIQKQSNLIKMQVLQNHVIQLNINRQYIQENKEAFGNIISYFKEQNKVQFHEKLSPKPQFHDLKYKEYLTKVIEFLDDIQKHQQKYYNVFKYSLAKLIMNKIIDLQMLNDEKTQKIIINNLEKTSLLFRLMHLNPSNYQIQDGDLFQFLDNQKFKEIQDLKNEIKQILWIPDNFCLVNKIIITPSIVIYGNEELVPLSCSFQEKKFYKKNSIIYLLDEDLNLFDFEETSEFFFQSIFGKYIKKNSVKIDDFEEYNNDAITSRCLQRNCLFATIREKDQSYKEDRSIEKTFLDFIQNSNVNYTQPVYTCQIDHIEIQGKHNDVGYINFKLLDKILSDAGYDYSDNKFSSIFLNYQLENGTNNLCTLFYYEKLQNVNFQMMFLFDDEQKKEVKTYEKVTFQIFSINKCKEKGFINKTNLGDFLDRKDLILKKLIEPISQDKFKGLELSLQLNEVKIQQKINQLESYLYQNIYPIQDSFIITGRKAIKINQQFENIYDQTKLELTKNFTINQIQLKLPIEKSDINKVLVAKKIGTFIGKFYAFDVLKGGNTYKSNEVKLNQSIILFHTDFQEYYFWPELYSQKEDVFQNNQREYIVIINPKVVTEEIQQFTSQKIKEIQNAKIGNNNKKQSDVLQESISESNILCNIQNIEKIKGQQFLKGIIKNNIKSQAMLLFYGEQVQLYNNDENKQGQQKDIKLNRESYLYELFSELNLNQPPFNLEKFKKEKKNYDFYFLLKSQLNHIVYSLNLQYKIKNKPLTQQHQNLEKNNKTFNLTCELYDDIQKQLSELNNQIKTSSNSYFQLHQFRNVFVEKELSLPNEILKLCIENMMTFYQNLDQLSTNYIQKRTDINQKYNLFYYDHKMQNKMLTGGYYLDLHELIKLYKKSQIKKITQNFVDYFNIYFKDELQIERQMHLYHEAHKPIIYVTNKATQLIKIQNQMKDKVFNLLKEAMYVINFYFITNNKKLDNHDLSQLEGDLKNLCLLAKDQLQNQIFYYNVLPKIIKSIEYNPNTQQYFVKKNMQTPQYFIKKNTGLFDTEISFINPAKYTEENTSFASLLDQSYIKNIK
ncbi:hypothetical protein ABPG74_004502 [Tetrahymena malaccensis]